MGKARSKSKSRSRKKRSRERREDKKKRSRSRDRKKRGRSRDRKKSRRSSSSSDSRSSSLRSAISGNGAIPSDVQGASAEQKGATLPQNVFLPGSAGEVDENAERKAEMEKVKGMYDENGWLKDGVAPPPPPPGPPPPSVLAAAEAARAANMTAQSSASHLSSVGGSGGSGGFSSGFSSAPPPMGHIPKGNASLSAPVCHYWIFGDCYKGASCEMRHSSTAEEVQAVAMRCKRMACKRGAGCPKFPRCSFSHPQEMGKYVLPSFVPEAVQTLGRASSSFHSGNQNIAPPKVPMISDGVAMM